MNTQDIRTDPEVSACAGDGTPGLSPVDALRAAESRVRAEPAVAAHRWALFQWLCIVCEWERAIQQLQVYAQLDSAGTRSQGNAIPVVHACRDLVRAERARANVMAGKAEAGFIFDDVPVWMQGLQAALGLAAQGEIEAADAARETALDMAPLVPGRCLGDGSQSESGAGPAFTWIGDSDSRLGPVCEFIAAGRYRWLAFDDIAHWRISRPASLIDLVWAPCSLTLRDGALLRGFMPARYPQVHAPESAPEKRDAWLMGRETAWRERGRTGVIASGAKTWTTSSGDFGLFELCDCTFGVEPNPGDGNPVPAADDGRSEQ